MKTWIKDGKIPCFKAYDLRGRIPDELNPELAKQVGLAYAKVVGAKHVVVGHDIRLSSVEVTAALVDGLTRGGVDVRTLGLCGTEEVYFATAHLELDGGIMVTASHNPVDYNGMKLVRHGSRPISGDSGLRDIEQAIVRGGLPEASRRGTVQPVDLRHEYIDHLLSFVNGGNRLRPYRVVVNAGNGCAGPVVDLLERRLPFELVKVSFEPDGNFPNGVPNPLLPENREATAEVVRQHGADLGVAWDGDFDRCFFFDENAEFIEGYYIVGLLAEQMLKQQPGAKIVHDPRLVWNTVELVQAAGGKSIQCRSGHAFIKECMREEDAAYGGEMSAHHYFRDFSYCDSGMLPWLLVAQSMTEQGTSLSQLVGQRMRRFPASGEINRKATNPEATLDAAVAEYKEKATTFETVDGVSLDMGDWRFNLRQSNTEPVVRLNVETRGDAALLSARTAELLNLMGRMG